MILITGCGGYIGQRLARALVARGACVRGLDRDGRALAGLAAAGVEWVVADVSDRAALAGALAGVTTVFHLAGSALGGRAEIERANVEGARSVAAACQAAGTVGALVFASSGALYPSGPGWLDEETEPAPAFAYARAKRAAEEALLGAHAAGGLPVVIARIAAAYGPGSPALMTEAVRRGRFPLIGGGRGFTSSIHIDDLVPALMALAEAGRPGAIYNLADDEPTTVATFYRHWAAVLGGPPPPSIPPLAARLLVFAAGRAARWRGRPSPLPDDLVAMASVSHRMSNTRMRRELGLTLRYPSYREGLPASLPGR